jgi:nucleoside-diphosphate-sugar epimerase
MITKDAGKALVTEAASFIGSHLVDRLVARELAREL